MNQPDMRATGVIRRIDDLGRIVIPKEIRRKMSIHEGNPLELYAGADFVAFKKYNPTKSIRRTLETLMDTVRDEPALEGKTDLLRKLAEFSTLLDEAEANGGAL